MPKKSPSKPLTMKIESEGREKFFSADEKTNEDFPETEDGYLLKALFQIRGIAIDEWTRAFIESGSKDKKAAESSLYGYRRDGEIPKDKKIKVARLLEIDIENIKNFDIYKWTKNFISKKLFFEKNKNVKERKLLNFPINISEENLEELFESYKGIYKCRYSWVRPYKTEHTQLGKKGEYKKYIYTTLFEIYERDKGSNFFNVRSTTYNEYKKYNKVSENIKYKWGWNGIMVPFNLNNFFIIMHKKGDEFPTIMCLESSKKVGKEDPIFGIFISIPSKSSICEGNVNISSTKVYLEFVKDGSKNILNKNDFSELCDEGDATHEDYIYLLNKIDKYGLLSYQNTEDNK